MKYVFAGVLGFTTLLATAQANDHLKLARIEIRESTLLLDGSQFSSVMTEDLQTGEHTKFQDVTAGLAVAGEVIRMGRELVALGEEVYVLVKKGEAVVNTDYAPISVLPRESGNAVDPMELENWRMPVVRTVNVAFKNIYGITMAGLEYKLLFSYGGSYNGKGAYITNAQIVPSKAHAFYGVTFNASMKLSGMTNHGTRANPVAGAMLQMSYKASTILSSIERTDTYQITGRGQIKKL